MEGFSAPNFAFFGGEFSAPPRHDNGRSPRQKSRGDNKMTYRTLMYAVHEYQTSKAGAIIESNFGGLRCFSLSLYSFSSPTFSHLLQNPFSVPKSWCLASAVSSPPSGSERSPAAKRIKCVLLCIIMFNG